MKTKNTCIEKCRTIKFWAVLIIIALSFANLSVVVGQGVGINSTGNAANAKAGLDIDFTNQGLLIPRLTTVQRDAITTPIPESLFIFNTTTKCFEAYVNGAWNTGFCPAACTPPATPTANAATDINCTSFTANWTASTGATYYLIDVATDFAFTSFVAGYNNLNVGNVTTFAVTGLTASTPYYYRVRSSTACASGSSAVINPTTLSTPAQPSVITGITPVCQGENGVAYSVTDVGGVTYTWSYSGTGFTQATGGTTNSITANFSAAATSGTLTVTPSNTCGNGTARTFAIVISETPTTAAAGTDINPACGETTATLAGNTATVGTGEWSVVSGTATITTPSSATSGVTGLAVPGTATLRWTISNAPCAASTDDVVITTTYCCGGTLSINHTAGSVAPETKSVNYGTVASSLSGATKCWITQNLGADNQASSATDATDASAGWYWQFNRTQGRKPGPIPAWTTSSIVESLDWQAANDPCTIELGTGWRIPTYTEWLDVDANGSWNNRTDAYNSALKLHAGGYLDVPGNGPLLSRGDWGGFWSSTRYSDDFGRLMFIKSDYSQTTSNGKAFGYSLRCLRD